MLEWMHIEKWKIASQTYRHAHLPLFIAQVKDFSFSICIFYLPHSHSVLLVASSKEKADVTIMQKGKGSAQKQG
jgi:hypothetical protein